MGARASQELDRWASVSDLALMSRKMRIIPTLPAECQVEALRYLWRSLRWVPTGEELLSPQTPCDSLMVIVRGEVQAILGRTNLIPMLPEGSFLCEFALLGRGRRRANDQSPSLAPSNAVSPLWAFRSWRKLPPPVLGLVEDFLVKDSAIPRFHGCVRTTRPSLIGHLTHGQFLAALRKAEDADAVPNFRELHVNRNVLWNVTAMGANARELGAQDIAALRVVCEGPMQISCSSVGATLRQAPKLLCGGCCCGPQRGEVEELRPHENERLPNEQVEELIPQPDRERMEEEEGL